MRTEGRKIKKSSIKQEKVVDNGERLLIFERHSWRNTPCTPCILRLTGRNGRKGKEETEK